MFDSMLSHGYQLDQLLWNVLQQERILILVGKLWSWIDFAL